MKLSEEMGLVALTARAEIIHWLGNDAVEAEELLSQHGDRLPEYGQKLVRENLRIANEKSIDALTDFQYNKNIMLIFFSFAIKTSMDQDGLSFSHASQCVFDSFSSATAEEREGFITQAYACFSEVSTTFEASNSGIVVTPSHQ